MAAIVILWPGLVTGWMDKPEQIDLDKVRIDVPIENYADPPPPAFPEAPAR
jgi:hypothetical protein